MIPLALGTAGLISLATGVNLLYNGTDSDTTALASLILMGLGVILVLISIGMVTT